jgi:hypothetical protein
MREGRHEPGEPASGKHQKHDHSSDHCSANPQCSGSARDSRWRIHHDVSQADCLSGTISINNLLFFAAWPMLAGCLTLHLLREYDTRWALDGHGRLLL